MSGGSKEFESALVDLTAAAAVGSSLYLARQVYPAVDHVIPHMGNIGGSGTVGIVAAAEAIRRIDDLSPESRTTQAFFVGVAAVLLANIVCETKYGAQLIDESGIHNGARGDVLDIPLGLCWGLMSTWMYTKIFRLNALKRENMSIPS